MTDVRNINYMMGIRLKHIIYEDHSPFHHNLRPVQSVFKKCQV